MQKLLSAPPYTIESLNVFIYDFFKGIFSVAPVLGISLKVFMIIDFHAHIYPDKIAEKATAAIKAFYDIKQSLPGNSEELIRRGSKISVVKYIVHSCATKVNQVIPINDYLINEINAHKEFVGFGTIQKGFEAFEAEIKRIRAAGMRGIKIHPDFQQFQADDSWMDDVYEVIAAEKMPVLFHAGDIRYDFSGPVRIAHVLQKHPTLDVVAAHFGGYTEWDASYEYLAGKRVWFDTSSSLWKLPLSEAKKIMKKHGVEKMLFGSDFPMWDPEEELERFDTLGLTGDERDMVLYKNALELLKKNE